VEDCDTYVLFHDQYGALVVWWWVGKMAVEMEMAVDVWVATEG
jgi:hypothetical protein